MKNIVDEWFKQAKYDMDTADAMFASERYIYAIFMCHLSIEKALISVPTRYPENLEKMIKEFTKDRTRAILNKGKEVLVWIENEYMK